MRVSVSSRRIEIGALRFEAPHCNASDGARGLGGKIRTGKEWSGSGMEAVRWT
ncbi:MAG TPA: hypothetical protein VKA74_04290 [Myxococcota bacterium]|nr:hypothetical protein [Myxococcota bacterium]